MSEDGVSLYRADDRLTFFPDASDTFAARVGEHSRYFLPILKLDASLAIPDLAGTLLPIAIPIEPTPGWGALGENSRKYHTRYCRENWMGWQVSDGRCEFLADFRFFHRALYEDSPPGPDQQDEADEIAEHYRETREAWELRREFFQQHGWICADPQTWEPSEKDGPGELDSLVSVGGESYDGNWSAQGWPSDLPINRYPDHEHFPLTEPGFPERGRVYPATEYWEDFRYICGIEMWRYIGDTNGFLLVFYDPADQLLVSIIDWS